MELVVLLQHIKQTTGYDFSGYKMSTLKRRIARRMQATGTNSYEEYLKYLENYNDEYEKLISELTIKVTEFFRDPESWVVLKENIIPEIIKSQSPIRVWSAGCATGEETYSLAILFKEAIDYQLPIDLQLYGTDICEKSLRKAKEGIYTLDSLKNIDKYLLEKYFIPLPHADSPNKGRFMVKDELKKIVKFSKHCLVSGYRFAGFNFIVCRNVLIYFSRTLQEKVIENFYNGLKPGGYLWLGKAESPVGEKAEYLKAVFPKEKIYQKVN